MMSASVQPHRFACTLLLLFGLASFLSSPGSAHAQPTNAELKTAGLLSILDPEFGTNCKSDGSTDCTQTIQKTMDKAYKDNLITYFPPGTYKISSTLVALKDRGKKNQINYQLVGSTAGTELPTIVLAPNSFNDGNGANDSRAENKKAMIHMWACTGTRENQEGPDGCTPPYNQQLNDVNLTDGGGGVLYAAVLRNLKFVIGNSNPDAIGVRISGNQHNEVSNIEIVATGAFAGYWGTVGTNAFVQDLSVTGGKYGAYNSTGSWGAYTNVTLIDQEILAFTSPQGPPVSMSGFHIIKESAPAVGEVEGIGYSTNNTNHVGSFSLNDGTIEFRSNNSNQAAIRTPLDKQIAAVNVYVKNASKLVVAGSKTYEGNGNGWSKIGIFANTMPDIGYKLVDGVETRNEDYVAANTFQTTNVSPPNAYQLKMNHGIPDSLLPSPDVLIDLAKNPTSGVVNVATEGITPLTNVTNNSPDYANQISALINRSDIHTLFFPKGKYPIKSTLTLQRHTKMMGIQPALSILQTHPQWQPSAITDMVKTVNDAQGETVVAFMQLLTDQSKTNNKFNNLHWMVGKKSVIYATRKTGNYPAADASNNGCRNGPGWGTNNSWLWYSGNGGGRMWGADASSSNCPRWSKEHRAILVDGTTQPLIMYGLNPEDGHGEQDSEREGFMTEIRNAKNVSVRSHKSENANSLLVRNSENIFILNPGGSVDWSLRDNAKLLVMNTAPKFIRWNKTETDPGVLKDMIEEELNGTIIKQYKTDKVVSLIKRGDIDFSVWTYDGTFAPTPTAGPTPTQGPTPTSGDEPEDWDLDNDGDVDVFDFNKFVKRVMTGDEAWSRLSDFIEALRAN